jgi:hypothetical protein
MMRRLLVLVVIFFPVVAMAADPGTAKGKITFNGKSKDLAYAYAWKDKDQTVVLLSDTKLDENLFGDKFKLIDLAKKDKFTGVQVPIKANGDLGTGTFYTAAEDGYFDAAGMHKWEKKSQSASSIEGKLSAPEGHFFKTSYSYSATFQAPIGPTPKK